MGKEIKDGTDMREQDHDDRAEEKVNSCILGFYLYHLSRDSNVSRDSDYVFGILCFGPTCSSSRAETRLS
jgi:hypothetical protein